MRPALEELSRRLLNKNYSEEVVNRIIKEIEPFVGYGWYQPHILATIYAYPFNCWKLLKFIFMYLLIML